MKQLSKDQKLFLGLNLVFLTGALVYPLYCYWVFHFSTPFSHCFLKEWFGVYCPLCGGTRALYELLHFRLLSALRYNAYVVLFAVLVILWDIVTFIGFLRGRKTFFRIPKWVYLVLTALLFLFFAIRTFLFFAYGIDPIGDLL